MAIFLPDIWILNTFNNRQKVENFKEKTTNKKNPRPGEMLQKLLAKPAKVYTIQLSHNVNRLVQNRKNTFLPGGLE